MQTALLSATITSIAAPGSGLAHVLRTCLASRKLRNARRSCSSACRPARRLDQVAAADGAQQARDQADHQAADDGHGDHLQAKRVVGRGQVLDRQPLAEEQIGEEADQGQQQARGEGVKGADDGGEGGDAQQGTSPEKSRREG